MDFDGDGSLDMISGCYDPGDIYLFRGLGKGQYEKGRPIRDEKDVPLVHHPAEYVAYEAIKAVDHSSGKALRLRTASFGSWPAAVDWDGDGDLDVLIGAFDGTLWLRINKGARTGPLYAAESEPVLADGQPLKVHGHAAPVAADWDGDGLWDLVVGADDGEVRWYRNRGGETAPEFGPGQALLAARSSNKFLLQTLRPDEAPGRGVRNQICVTDWNGDGQLDLVVGDYSRVRRLRRDVDAKGKAELDKLEAELAELTDGDGAKADGDARAKERENLEQAIGRFCDKAATQSFVWLYLRR